VKICPSWLAVGAAGWIARRKLSRAERGRTLLSLNELLALANPSGQPIHEIAEGSLLNGTMQPPDSPQTLPAFRAVQF
jgi:hypothetical protein